MLRFLLTCVILAGATVVGVVLIGQFTMGDNPSPAVPKTGSTQGGGTTSETNGSEENKGEDTRTRDSGMDAKAIGVIPVAVQSGSSQQTIIQGARVLPLEKQEVPSERNGKLVLLGTPIEPGEWVPKNRLIELEIATLAVVVPPGEVIPNGEEIVNPAKPNVRYRRPRKTDNFTPGTTSIVRHKLRFRKLAQDDRVKAGQILGIINPDVALEEVAMKQARLEASAADVLASQAMVVEYERRLSMYRGLLARGGISKDEYGATEASLEKTKQETLAKRAAVVQSQRELSASWTTLEMYVIRASIPGRIRHIYKNMGDAVRELDPVLQIQNSEELKVEAQIEVQDALPLRQRLKEAEKHLIQARELMQSKNPADIKVGNEHLAKALDLQKVEIEVSRPEPPMAVLSGHLQEVTCVAVCPKGRIVSGSEEGLVRVWERVNGADRWQERLRLDHGTPIRAVACANSPKAKKHLLVTATATGRLRFFDANKLTETGKYPLSERHQGSVHAVAINEDATLVASAGDDRTIYIWDTVEEKLLMKQPRAHAQPITSLSFTPDGKLISIGRDKKLAIWEVQENGKKLKLIDDVRGRSGDVAHLGLDPTGKRILFDEGRELRVLDIESRRIEGSLVNPGATGTFSILAQFSPDGNSILTNGNGPGRLQLWRAPSPKTRAAELRQYLWNTGTVNCAAFDPNGQFVVTGTSDHRVLVWDLPTQKEAEKPLPARLTYVEESLDTGMQRVTVRATMDNPGYVQSGTQAAIVIPRVPAK